MFSDTFSLLRNPVNSVTSITPELSIYYKMIIIVKRILLKLLTLS